MSRDGRGNPGRYVPKNKPKLRLSDVIRRRKTTLALFITDLGVSTYAGLENWCDRMGVVPPTRSEFQGVIPPDLYVNSPQEGVIVLEAPRVIDESTGTQIDNETSFDTGAENFTDVEQLVAQTDVQPTKTTQKKARAKKDSQSSEN